MTKGQNVGRGHAASALPRRNHAAIRLRTKCWCCRKPRIRSSRIAFPIGMIRPSKAFGTIRAARRQSPNRTRPALPLLGRSRNHRRSRQTLPRPRDRSHPRGQRLPRPPPRNRRRRVPPRLSSCQDRLLLVPLRLLSWREPPLQRRRRAPPLRRASPRRNRSRRRPNRMSLPK